MSHLLNAARAVAGTFSFGSATKEAAYIIAQRTPRDTVLVVNVEDWHKSSVRVLAEAARENQCPKHWIAKGVAEKGVMDSLWRANRSTRAAVEALNVQFASAAAPETARASSAIPTRTTPPF
jgi:hypothetical protein